MPHQSQGARLWLRPEKRKDANSAISMDQSTVAGISPRAALRMKMIKQREKTRRARRNQTANTVVRLWRRDRHASGQRACSTV